ncbi:MAG TPA: STAS domain-containing protein [Solirubrobacteraceae bacterium]|jgi:anti-anti-sigma factor|nr:STAS domain-containing protein [Solirubrobacteraceae bacterium]
MTAPQPPDARLPVDRDGRFEVNVIPDRERVVVAPAGEIDLATAPRMQQDVVELLERGFTRVVVDLRRVEFLDSQGIRALVLAHNRAHELGATMPVVLGNADAARRALELSGVLAFLDVDA